jgi:hypothetical protein
MSKTKLKQTITDCLNKVHNSEGQIDKAIKEAMRAIDEFEKSLYPKVQEKDLTAFVYGRMNIKDSANLLEGKVVYLKANSISSLSHIDTELVKDFLDESVLHCDYHELHDFCSNFLMADMMGKISKKEIEELID